MHTGVKVQMATQEYARPHKVDLGSLSRQKFPSWQTVRKGSSCLQKCHPKLWEWHIHLLDICDLDCTEVVYPEPGDSHQRKDQQNLM